MSLKRIKIPAEAPKTPLISEIIIDRFAGKIAQISLMFKITYIRAL